MTNKLISDKNLKGLYTSTSVIIMITIPLLPRGKKYGLDKVKLNTLYLNQRVAGGTPSDPESDKTEFTYFNKVLFVL